MQRLGNSGSPTTNPNACNTADAAQGRPATASSVENAGTPAGNAVDGNATTRWSSAFADPQWLQVDLGASATVCGVQLSWEAAYATAFRIQVSANASTWTDVYSTSGMWETVGNYYRAAPANYYAKFWHDHALSRLAYGFPYDDVAGQSSFISHANPQYLLVAVGW